MAKGSIRLSKEHGLNPSLLVCPLCYKETNSLALLGKMKATELDKDPEAPRYILDAEPCDRCKGLMKQGVFFMEAKSVNGAPVRTGRFIVLKDSAVCDIIQDQKMLADTLNKRVILIDAEACAKLGFFQKDEENANAGGN